MAGFLGALDAKRIDPEVFAVRDAAFAGNLAESITPFAAARSSIGKRRRQDAGLPHAGPARLRIRARPGADRLSRAGRAEAALDRPQRTRALVGHRGGHAGDARRERPVVRPLSPRRRVDAARQAGRGLARGAGAASRCGSPEKPEGCRARPPPVPDAGCERPGAVGPLPARARASTRPTEVGGAPTVQVTANASGGWSRLVAVLSAGRPPARRSSWRREACRPGRAGARPHRPQRPGHVPAQRVAPHAHPRLVDARAEPGQPPLPRPPARADRAARRHGRLRRPPRARDARRDEAGAAVLGAALVAATPAAAGTTADPASPRRAS